MADVSRHYYQWSLPDGNIKFKTIFGAALTFLLFLSVLAYAVTQFITFWERSSYTVLETTAENIYLDNNFAIGKEEGFVVAAAFVGGSNLTPDPEIGELKFILKSWSDASGDLEFRDLKDRKCTEEDFKSVNRDPSEYGFYSMDGSTEDIVKKSGYDLRCIGDDFNVRGDFNTNSANNLMITFELCDRTKRTCKS